MQVVNKKMSASKKLKNQVSALVDYIYDYESDTFTSSGFTLTKKEAKKIASELIKNLENQIDGVTLDEILYEIRKTEEILNEL